MKTITNIIKNITELELNFELFNLRILEFANSTNKSDLDSTLLKKYIGSVEEYIGLINEYKEEVLFMNENDADFSSQKKLVLFRLEKLGKIFNNTLSKLKLINTSFPVVGQTKEIVNVDFETRDEMLEINKSLYEFYNSYNKNLEFQKDYNINIKLNDSFESRKEKELSSLELVQFENIYMTELNSVFEYLEKIDNDFNILLTKSLKLDKKFFKNFLNKYYPKNKYSFFVTLFIEKLESEYLNKDFYVQGSHFYQDFLKFKKIASKEYSNLITIVNIFVFQEKYSSYEYLNGKHSLIGVTSIVEYNYNFYKKIKNINFNSTIEVIKEIITNSKFKNITEIKINNDLFFKSLRLLENFDLLNNDYSDKLNFGFMGNIYSLLEFPDVSHRYLTKGLQNLKEEFNNELKNYKLNTIGGVIIFIKIIEKYDKILINLKKTIVNLESYILNSIVFNTVSLGTYKLKTIGKMKKLSSILNLDNNSQLVNEFEKNIINIMISKYNSSKKNYYAEQRARSRSSLSSSSVWSSGGSSFSSGYSSSGSSSW